MVTACLALAACRGPLPKPAADTAEVEGAPADEAPPCDLGALQRRVDAAPPGAVVEACPGRLRGGLVLWQDIVLVAHPDGTVIDAAGEGPAVWVLSGAATLRGLGLTGGVGVAEAGFSSEDQPVGGGVSAWRSAGLRLEGCHVYANTAAWGGGVFGSEDGPTELIDTVVEDNLADTLGGGVWMRQGALAGSRIARNTAPYAGGLALRRRPGTPAVMVALNDTLIEDNDGDVQGGGLLLLGAVSVTGGTLRANRSQMGANLHAFTWTGALIGAQLIEGEAQVGGGGALIEDSPAARFVGVELRGNRATLPGLRPVGNVGGGLWATNSALRVEDSLFIDNAADWGGALLSAAVPEREAEAQITLVDATFEGNDAVVQGGALALVNGQLTVIGGAVGGNAAGAAGGGLHLSGGVATLLGVGWGSPAPNLPEDLAGPLGALPAPAEARLRCTPDGCFALP